MAGIAGVLYGGIAYLVFLASSIYALGFVANLWVPKSIDSGGEGGSLESMLIDFALLGVFAVQHSVMARPAFKALWTTVVPRSVERATYVLVTSLILFLIFGQWRALPAAVWDLDNETARFGVWALYWLGWLIVLLSTFMISHWDLFGLRQVLLALQGRDYTDPPFMARGFYRLVRHPLMLGFIIVFWAAPTMTMGHLLFAAASTAYIVIAVQFEEKDLTDALGEDYRDYVHRVPMLVPGTKRTSKAGSKRKQA